MIQQTFYTCGVLQKEASGLAQGLAHILYHVSRLHQCLGCNIKQHLQNSNPPPPTPPPVPEFVGCISLGETIFSFSFIVALPA